MLHEEFGILNWLFLTGVPWGQSAREHLGPVRFLLLLHIIGCFLDLDGYSCAQENWEICRAGLEKVEITTNHHELCSGSGIRSSLVAFLLCNFPLL